MTTGVDVGHKRIDRLAREVLGFALNWSVPIRSYVEIGAGKGRLAVIMALLNFRVLLFDKDIALKNHYQRIVKAIGPDISLKFIPKDLRDLSYADVPQGIGIVVASRVLHYLRYREALGVLRILRNRMVKGGRIFVSLSGLHSPLAEGYPRAPIEERFFLLSEELRRKFSITEPVCLYSLQDAHRLMEEVGELRRVGSRITAFGNIELIYEKVT
ncbi:MAG: class I SAM-dependent methyltransferase [Thermotogae bacterium]|nr:class I SAM-dependent methyltransferase [Thermotogota bacterium]